jgi:hypothetical protein
MPLGKERGRKEDYSPFSNLMTNQVFSNVAFAPVYSPFSPEPATLQPT